MREITVITGGAGGMGLATARIVGRDRFVVLCDVNQARLDVAVAELESLGIEAKAITCDITDRGSVDELVASCAEFGTVASVIHTAGLSPSMATAEKIMKVNAIGTLNVNESFRRIAGDGFAMVNVASMAAYMLPDLAVPTRRFKQARKDKDVFFTKMMSVCNLAPTKLRPGMAYCLSKRFVVWYCKVAAKDFGSKGARIVSVSPGSIDTAMGRLEEQSGSGAMLASAALKRFGTPEEVAEVLAFCASDKPGYLTGVDLLVDGGVTAGVTLRAKLAIGRHI